MKKEKCRYQVDGVGESFCALDSMVIADRTKCTKKGCRKFSHPKHDADPSPIRDREG